MVIRLIPLLVLLLASCTLPDRTARAGCAVTPLATADIADVAHFLVVTAAIDGQPVSLLLDTGADSELVTPDAAERLRLPPDPARFTAIEGTGGSGGIAPHVLIRELLLGGIRVQRLSAPVGELPATPHVAPPVAGLIGADLLAHFDVELDVGHRRLTFHSITDTQAGGPSCADTALPPWKGKFDTIPLRRIGDRLLVDATLDGHRASALIDTGARSIVVGMGPARRAGAGPDQLAADPGGITGGVDMNDVGFHWHRFASLGIGGEVIPGPVLTVSRLHDTADILLGAPYFASRRVWLSYATNRMFVQPFGNVR